MAKLCETITIFFSLWKLLTTSSIKFIILDWTSPKVSPFGILKSLGFSLQLFKSSPWFSLKKEKVNPSKSPWFISLNFLLFSILRVGELFIASDVCMALCKSLENIRSIFKLLKHSFNKFDWLIPLAFKQISLTPWHFSNLFHSVSQWRTSFISIYKS